jgi:hypothetical protein
VSPGLCKSLWMVGIFKENRYATNVAVLSYECCPIIEEFKFEKRREASRNNYWPGAKCGRLCLADRADREKFWTENTA